VVSEGRRPDTQAELANERTYLAWLRTGLARLRWHSVDRALRAGRPIPHPILGYLVATVIVVDGLATIVLLLRADAG
jgi:uncharacterized membrane protein YidH (DUF202 family)